MGKIQGETGEDARGGGARVWGAASSIMGSKDITFVIAWGPRV
jgi:hypothetical protein